MGNEPIIDLVVLEKMLNEGVNQREISKHFGVSDAAISKAKGRLKKTFIETTTQKQIKRVVKQKIDAIEQLQKINRDANKVLDQAMQRLKGNKKAPQVSVVKDPRELALKAMAEIRGQLNLQLEIFKTLYDMKAMQEFQEEVLEVIGKVNPSARAAIIEGLNSRRAVRGSITFHQ